MEFDRQDAKSAKMKRVLEFLGVLDALAVNFTFELTEFGSPCSEELESQMNRWGAGISECIHFHVTWFVNLSSSHELCAKSGSLRDGIRQ